MPSSSSIRRRSISRFKNPLGGIPGRGIAARIATGLRKAGAGLLARLDLGERLRDRLDRIAVYLQTMWRARLRDQEVAILMLSALTGIGAALGVVLLRKAVSEFHVLAFDIPEGAHLSDGNDFAWWRALLLPTLGGLAIGVSAWAIRRWRPHDIIDAIEANALFGGRMSLVDSMNLAFLTLISGGFGASVGLEAAYTQLGAGLCSRVGRLLRLRRTDMRTLVGCGAAAAIAAAFNAPLTGAFYAFELIIGSYTLPTLAPVAIAAICGTVTARATFGAEPVFIVNRAVHLDNWDYAMFCLLGLASAGLGIILMRGVTGTEGWFRRRSIPAPLRPALGGLLVGAVALVYPQILGSGHGGIVANLHVDNSLPFLTGLIAAKIVASAVSIGAGFRGGLFSSSLFLGSLFGAAAGAGLRHLAPGWDVDPLAYTLVGMGAVGAAVVGAPIAMILLVLEVTGDFSATIGVMVGVIIANVAVRHWFGYSFATWRFHLRGLKILGAEDIGWLDQLRVGRLMRSDAKMIPREMTVAALRRLYPLGSTKQIVVVDDGALVGVLDLPELHGPDLVGDLDTMVVGVLITQEPVFLLPGDDVQYALRRFTAAAVETLPVVDDPESRRVLGYLTEAYALRRYTQELERRRALQDGESTLFSGAMTPKG